MKDTDIAVYGKNAFLAALATYPQGIRQVFIEEKLHDEDIWRAIKAANLVPKNLSPKTADYLVGGAVHQGIVAEFDGSLLLKRFDTLDCIQSPTTDTCVVVLGELTDPQNVGAIIRSATAFGASAVLIPEHNQASLSGTVIKASAGTAFSIPLVPIGNVNQALRVLKEKGFWVYGLAMDGHNPLATEKFTEPTVFVIGSEGEGLREKTREHCDILLSIPMSARAESLNASVAAAVCLHQWSVQHKGAL
jgi:23S rRNA (guanosine2251-2'-O)-methyltransferase